MLAKAQGMRGGALDAVESVGADQAVAIIAPGPSLDKPCPVVGTVKVCHFPG